MISVHKTVLLKQAVEELKVSKGKTYVDLTLGGGGHSKEIIDRLSGNGRLIAFDVDEQAIERFVSYLKGKGFTQKNNEFRKENLTVIVINKNFNNLKTVLEDLEIKEVNGVLADLGTSSDQIEFEEGFSIKRNEKLDMRMDKSLNVTAADLINALSKKQLEDLMYKYSDEPNSRRIAKRIIDVRKVKRIETTNDLLQIIDSAVKYQNHRGTLRDLLPATRVFQAFRIAVNLEIDSLSSVLPQTLEPMVAGSRLVVISFHSGEDRVVKDFLKIAHQKGQLHIITKKPVTPSEEELVANRRARSAKMRIAEKL